MLLFHVRMTRTLRFAFILLAAATLASSCGGSSGTSTGNTTPTSPTTGNNGTPVSIVQGALVLSTTAYNPNPVTVSAGSTVTWTNNDSTTHTATSDGGVFNGTLATGAQFSFMFANKGTFTYHCSIHPNMVGTITVQ